MGNRGCLHNAEGQIIRNSRSKAWITCLTKLPGVRRQLMAPNQYTELFFLDEATALAAGHRPCGYCRHTALTAFKKAWAQAHGLSNLPTVNQIDASLHNERNHLTACPSPDALPNGAMVTLEDGNLAWLRHQGSWRAWSFEGYGERTDLPEAKARLITPPSIIATMLAGYTLTDLPEIPG